VGTDLGLHWMPPVELLRSEGRVEFTLETPHAAASAMRLGLDARMDRAGQFMRVTLVDEDQDRVAPMLNAVLERYVDLAAVLKRARLTEATKVLTEQLARSEVELATAEAALQRFQVQTITQPTEPDVPVSAGSQQTQPTVITSYFSMKFLQDDLKNDREELAELLASLPDSGLSLDVIQAIPAVQASGEISSYIGTLIGKRAEVRELLSQYTAQHSSVRRVQQDVKKLETVDIPQALRRLAIEIDARITDYDGRLAVVANELEDIPPRYIEEQRLRRNVDIAAQIYTSLEARFQSAQLAEASSIPDIRILDRAVPPREPTQNQAPQLLLMAVAAGLGVGIAGAILLDLLDKRVRYPEQITKDLGLHILGGVPRVSGGKRGLQGDDLNQIIESLRGIRLNLIHSYGGSGPLLLTITSPGGGDGKSFVSSNLALAFAEAGHRTVLIDGDIRRGRQHKLFNVERKPGLTEVLTGEASRDEALQETEFSYLSFMPCGTRTHNAPELLGSATMSQMLSALRATYSVIIVDSPPMAAGIDAFSLGSLTKNLMLVIRNGTTDRDLAGAKLDILNRLPINVLGAVLNDIKPGGPYGYYGYYTYYLPGYAAEDELVDSDKLVLKQEANT
jgi:capsular exopolysaccharide synthesis family protein